MRREQEVRTEGVGAKTRRARRARRVSEGVLNDLWSWDLDLGRRQHSSQTAIEHEKWHSARRDSCGSRDEELLPPWQDSHLRQPASLTLRVTALAPKSFNLRQLPRRCLGAVHQRSRTFSERKTQRPKDSRPLCVRFGVAFPAARCSAIVKRYSPCVYELVRLGIRAELAV